MRNNDNENMWSTCFIVFSEESEGKKNKLCEAKLDTNSILLNRKRSLWTTTMKNLYKYMEEMVRYKTYTSDWISKKFYEILTSIHMKMYVPI